MTLDYTMRIQQGETWRKRFPIISDDPESSTIIGLVARAQARNGTGSTGVLLYEWTTTAGNLTVDTDSITLTVPAATSSAWTWQRGRWGLELADPDTGESATLASGPVIVYPEVVHD